MNGKMIWRLILKDWYLNRGIILFYLLFGLISLAIMASSIEDSFYVGAILLIVVLFSLGVHIVMGSVLYERVEMTLPFVMSLPISAIDYTAAKIVAILGVFLVPWSAIVAGTCVVTLTNDGIPNGALTYFLIILVEFLIIFSLLLAAAIVSEATAWTVATIVASNLLLQYTMSALSHIPEFEMSVKSDQVTWSPLVLSFLGCELLIVVAILVGTFFLQSRKTDFI